MTNDWTNELQCYNAILRKLSASRAAVSDIPPPKKYTDLATHPEGEHHLLSFEKEVASFHKHDMTLPPDIDVKDIPPELILQYGTKNTKALTSLSSSAAWSR